MLKKYPKSTLVSWTKKQQTLYFLLKTLVIQLVTTHTDPESNLKKGIFGIIEKESPVMGIFEEVASCFL